MTLKQSTALAALSALAMKRNRRSVGTDTIAVRRADEKLDL
jgi:hypothetical protein